MQPTILASSDLQASASRALFVEIYGVLWWAKLQECKFASTEVLPVWLACEAWGLHQSLNRKLDSSVPVVHEHDRLVGGLIRQAGSQTDCVAGKRGLGVRLLLLMQEGVAPRLCNSKQCPQRLGLTLASSYSGL